MRSQEPKIEINNKAGCDIDLNLVEKVVRIFCRVYKISGKSEISLAFVSDREMRKLNFYCRGADRITDVLSFEGEGNFFGEIIMDYSQIKRQAKNSKTGAKDELIFVLVHGLLHLAGHDDDSERNMIKMIKSGKRFMKKYL